jgi:kynurenine formamidase
MTKLKALSVIQSREYVMEKHGLDGVERVKSVMKRESRDIVYSEHLLPTDWVDVRYGVDHARGYDIAFGLGDGREAARMIRELTAKHLAGLYRSVLATSDPHTILERSSRLWPRYYDQGESQIILLGDTHAVKRILGCPDLPRHHDWLLSPYYEELLRHCRVKDIVLKHTQCVANGADVCETEMRWRAHVTSDYPFDG